MNIHFKDKKLFEDLNKQSIATFKIGSHMYGLNNKNSDIDFLTIYIEPDKNKNSIMWEHHQLQFKKDNIDYNFSTLQTFIRNILTGDSTINFEILWSSDILNSKLNWLADFKKYFINYNIIRSYLGFAKRDLKYWRKDTKNGKIHTIETHKKLSHFVRGIIFAKMLINNNFTLNLNNQSTFNINNYTDLELLDRLKNGNLDYSFLTLTNELEQKMNFLRLKNNSNHEKGLIVTYMNENILKFLDFQIISFSNLFDNKIEYLNYKNLFYSTLENGLKYD